MSRCEIGFEVQSPAELGDRFFEVSLVHQSIAEVIVRVGVLGLEPQCFAELGDRFFEVSLVVQSRAEAIVGRETSRPDCDRDREVPASSAGLSYDKRALCD